MRFTRLAATICALSLVTGLIVYGGIFLWPGLAGSAPKIMDRNNDGPRYLFSIGGVSGPVRPNAMALDKKGRVYVTDGGSGKVFVYSENGRKLAEFGHPGTGKSDFGFANGIVVTKEGNLMIADSTNNDIKVFNPDGKYLKTVLKSSDHVKPGYMSQGSDRLIYVSDLLNKQILVMDENGVKHRVVGTSEKPLSYPQGTAVDKNGMLWVADSGNYSIRIFDAKGHQVNEIKGGGQPETPFSMLRGIAFDQTGRAFIADTIAHKIRVFNSEGKQLYTFPTSEASKNLLIFPTTVVMGPGNKLYVVDRGAGGVRVFSVDSLK